MQPLEAALAVAAGLAALAVVLLLRPARTGSVAVAAYTLGRQFLLGLRADPPRRSPRSGLVTAAAVLIASITVFALGAA